MNSDKDQRELRQGLRDQLLERLKSNLTEYFDSLRNDANLSLGGAAPEIAAVFGAYHYITAHCGYTDSQIRYLLLFQNPLSVVADGFQASGIDDHSDVMWDIFDKQDALHNGYELVADVVAMKSQLFERLDQNLTGIMDTYLNEIANPSLSVEELRGMAERITAVNVAHEYLKNEFEFEYGDVEYLLQFRVPLQIVAAAWPNSADRATNVNEVIREVLDDRDEQGYGPHTPAPIEAANAEESACDASQKPSVLEQIRKARSEQPEIPAPQKDKPGKGRGPEL